MGHGGPPAIQWEESPSIRGRGVVLYAQRVERADPPDDPLVYFR